MNVFYVYTHSTSVGGDVFYVGKGKGRRAWARSGRSQQWSDVVSKFGLVVSLVEEGLTEDEAYLLEEKLISSYKALGNKLVNKTNGGGGTSGWACGEETKKKISNKTSIRTYCSNGMVFSSRREAVSWLKSIGFENASVTCISKACNGKSISSYGFSWSNKGIPETPKTYGKESSSKTVRESQSKAVFTDFGDTFVSVTDAVLHLRNAGYKGASVGSISNVCLGRKKTYHGMRFSYLDEFNAPAAANVGRYDRLRVAA